MDHPDIHVPEQEPSSVAQIAVENPDPILRMTGDGRLIYANPAAQELLKDASCPCDSALRGLRAEVETVLRSGQRRQYDWPCNGRVFCFTCIPAPDKSFATLYGHDATQAHLSAEALAALEQKFHIVADHTHAWEFWVGPNDEFLYSSSACEAVTGYACEAFEADPGLFRRIVHPDDLDLFDRHRGSAEYVGAGAEVEFRIIGRDGAVRWIAHCCHPVHDEKGHLLGTRGSNRDITEKRQAQDALRESRQMLRLVLDTIPVRVFWKDMNLAYLGCNRPFVQDAGLDSVDQMVGKNDYDMPWREQADAYRADDRHVLQTGQAKLRYEEPQTGPDGQMLVLRTSKIPLRDATGKIIGMMGTYEDITDYKRVEARLRDSEFFYRQMIDSMPAVVFTTRPDGYCDFQNQPWLELTGSQLGEHFGDNWTKRLHPDDRERALAAWHEAVAGRAPYDLEYRVLRRDGVYRWFKVRGQPIRNAQGQIVRWFGALLDIDDLKRAQEELARARAAAEEANQAKDRFLAVLSHELRTPLTPVLASVSLLQKSPRLDREAARDLEMIRRNVELEARLIDDLLDINRIVRGRVELNKHPVDLRSVIGRAVDVCRPDIDARGLEFGVDFGEGSYMIEADAGRLQQVFWNLLKNAIKFTPLGGCVGIKARAVNAGQVEVEVSDSGIGIAPEALPRIFDAFAQADRTIAREFGGLGLGLAISKSLVEMHGGSIDVRSAGKTKGATFRVCLPLLTQAVQAEESRISHEPPKASGRPRSLRVLVVEDHGDTAEMIRLILGSEGHRVELAGDVQTGLAAAQTSEFDLLISDLGLPDGSGLDLMRALRAGGFSKPGIALSGYGQEQDIQNSRQAGFSAHITKPVDMDRLIGAVAEVASSAQRTP